MKLWLTLSLFFMSSCVLDLGFGGACDKSSLLAGTITDNGTPVANAEVTIKGTSTSTTTDINGAYRLPYQGRDNGQGITLNISKNGYVTLTVTARGKSSSGDICGQLTMSNNYDFAN
jgi:hypothetical protein